VDGAWRFELKLARLSMVPYLVKTAVIDADAHVIETERTWDYPRKI
jgi:hypothetical protein